MNPAGSSPRDDKARRRRRRPPPPSTTAQPVQHDTDMPPPCSRPPRRGRPSPSTLARHKRSQSPSTTHISGPHGQPAGTHFSHANYTRRERLGPSCTETASPNFPSNSTSGPLTKSHSQPDQTKPPNAGLHDSSKKDERAIAEAREREAQEEANRAAQAARLLIKRGEERQQNLAYLPSSSGEEPKSHRPSDAELRQLDSSLKKCTGFLRKIRFSGINEESVSSLCAEAQALNLSRYISEVISALTETKLRSADVEHFIILVGQLHRRYDEFGSQLFTVLSSIVLNTCATQKELLFRKAAMRVLVEMFTLAVSPDFSNISNILRQLVRSMRDSKDEQLNNLAIVASFVRAGSRSLLMKSTDRTPEISAQGEEDEPRSNANGPAGSDASWEDNVLSQALKQTIYNTLQTYFEGEVDRLVKGALDDLRKASDAVNRARQVRDTPDDATVASFDAAKQFCDRTVTNANVLADVLGKDQYPASIDALRSSLPLEGNAESRQVSVANLCSYVSKNRQGSDDVDFVQHADHPFESDEQRMFYTEIVSVESITGAKNQSNGEGGSKAADAGSRKQESGNGRSEASPLKSESKKRGADKPLSIERIVAKLSSIETKDAADLFVQQFVASREGSRNGTKRLAKALFTVSPQKLNVLPAYSRISASLQPLYPDVPSTVASGLEDDFRFFVGRADVDEKHLAACIKSAQYIGEYVKFGLISIGSMFDLLSLCMKDLTGHRIDAACHLLESCGRYVYRTPSSHARMGNILDTLWRVKSVRNLEARYNTLIENAFFSVKLSSGSKAQKVKVRPPLHEYIRHLLYHRLDETNVTWVRQQLLKLPWDDELEKYVAKKFVKISKVRYSTIPHVAYLMSSLQKHKPSLVVGITDALIESIMAGMERNDGRDSQRRLSEVFLLGEMLNCDAIDEKLVYNVLFLIITLGHDTSDLRGYGFKKSPDPPRDPSLNTDSTNPRPLNGTHGGVPDPPGDFFRIRLACVLVESCGKALIASNRRALEVFWTFLERYLFCKTYQAGFGDRVPLHIDHMMQDVLDSVTLGHRRWTRDSRGPVARGGASKFQSGRNEPNLHVLQNIRPIPRCHSLEDALKAVARVERSPTDAALIFVPVRQVAHRTGQIRDGNTRIDSAIVSAHGQTESGVLERSVDELQTADAATDGHGRGQSEDGEEEGDSMTDGMSHDEDGTIIDEDDDLSEDISDADESTDEYDDDDEVDEDDMDEDDMDDEEDDLVLEARPSCPRSEEEEAFAKELAAFTAEAVHDARESMPRITKLDRMTIPMSLMSKRLEEERAAAAAQAVNAMDGSESSEDDHSGGHRSRKHGESMKTVDFKMLLRKGGKSQLQDLKVPAKSSLAVAAKENESADAKRHEETKRLVLESSVLQDEDTFDFESEVPFQVEQNARAKEESIRRQRSADEMELISTLYRPKQRR